MNRALFTCSHCTTTQPVRTVDVAVRPGVEGRGDTVRIYCPSCHRIDRRLVPGNVGVALTMGGAHVQLGDAISPPDVLAFLHDLTRHELLAPMAGAHDTT